MNIGSYTLVKKRIIKELEEEKEKKEKQIKDLEQYLKNLKKYVSVLEEYDKKNTEILRVRSNELYVYDIFIDCIFDRDMRKVISIYNKTKSIRIRQKCFNSISKKLGKVR